MTDRELQQKPGSESERRQVQQQGQDIEIRDRAQMLLSESRDSLKTSERGLDDLRKRKIDLQELQNDRHDDARTKDLEELERQVDQAEQQYNKYADCVKTLEHIEQNASLMDTELQMLANSVLNQIEQGKYLNKWIASCEAQSQQLQRAALREMQASVEARNLDQGAAEKALAKVNELSKNCEENGRRSAEIAEVRKVLGQDADPSTRCALLRDLLRDLDEQGNLAKSLDTLNRMQEILTQHPEKALRDLDRHVKECENRGYALREMRDLRAVLSDNINPAEKVDRLRDVLKDFEKRDLLRSGLTIADIPELKAVWETARGRVNSPNNYDNVRNMFYKLLHPEVSRNFDGAERERIESGRKFLEAAGYTFEDTKPGNAPRLVADQRLSKNDYTLSLQHDIMQKNILHEKEVSKHLLTDPGNIRLETTRDNIIEDAMRERELADRIRQQVDIAQDMLKNSGSKIKSDDLQLTRNVEKEVRDRLLQLKDLSAELQHLQRADLSLHSQLRIQYAIQKEKDDLAMQQPVTNSLEELGRQQEESRQTKRIELQNKLEAQNLSQNLAQDKVINQMKDVICDLRKQFSQVETKKREGDAWEKLLRELEERRKELEREADLPSH